MTLNEQKMYVVFQGTIEKIVSENEELFDGYCYYDNDMFSLMTDSLMNVLFAVKQNQDFLKQENIEL